MFLTSLQVRMLLLGLMTGFENHFWKKALPKNVFMVVCFSNEKRGGMKMNG